MKKFGYYLSMETDDPNGEVQITLLQKADGKVTNERKWTAPDIIDGVFIFTHQAKEVRNFIERVNTEMQPQGAMTIIKASDIAKIIPGILGNLGFTGNPFDPFAPIIKVGDAKEEKKEDEVPEVRD